MTFVSASVGPLASPDAPLRLEASAASLGSGGGQLTRLLRPVGLLAVCVPLPFEAPRPVPPPFRAKLSSGPALRTVAGNPRLGRPASHCLQQGRVRPDMVRGAQQAALPRGR